jgi:hypothetical protein
MECEKEVRSYGYHGVQQHIDRQISERHHLEAIKVSREQHDWLEKLQVARDKCLKVIGKASQLSVLATVIAQVARRMYDLLQSPAYLRMLDIGPYAAAKDMLFDGCYVEEAVSQAVSSWSVTSLMQWAGIPPVPLYDFNYCALGRLSYLGVPLVLGFLAWILPRILPSMVQQGLKFVVALYGAMFHSGGVFAHQFRITLNCASIYMFLMFYVSLKHVQIVGNLRQKQKKYGAPDSSDLTEAMAWFDFLSQVCWALPFVVGALALFGWV